MYETYQSMKQKLDELLRVNIKQFDEGEGEGSGVGEGKESGDDDQGAGNDKGEKKDDKKSAKTFTQEELEAIVTKRLARKEEEKQKAIAEAEKLAKMNADEKQQYEFEKLKAENEALKAEKNKVSLGKEAAKMLSEANIFADDDVLEFVVRADAEQTKVAVSAFTKLVEKKVDEAVKEKLKGTPPKKPTGTPGALTKEDIMKIANASERVKKIQENPHLFN